MVIYSYHLPTKFLVMVGTLFSLTACFSKDSSSVEQDILMGTIAYPFVDESPQLGHPEAQEKFVIKSAAGGREYQIEIPGAARDYDVQIPIADLGSSEATGIGGFSKGQLTLPTTTTDHELTSIHPQLGKMKSSETTVLDSAFGVAEKEGPKQNPSFTLGLARINEAYRRKEYEISLVEINNMIAFFPTAPQLHKMKGTVLNKLRHYKLAELAWIRSLELDPTDRAVRRALERLQQRITFLGQKPGLLPGESLAIPKPVGTQANEAASSNIVPLSK